MFFFLKEALREQKSRREHQVTMYRKYRKGDLPDIQIKYSYIIAPLQAVAHVSIQRVICSVSDIQIIYSYIIHVAPIQAVVHVSIQRVIFSVSDIQINYCKRIIFGVYDIWRNMIFQRVSVNLI